MPSQQAADKNGIQISSKTHTRVQELLRRGTMSASKAGMESPAILLIYDPKHIRKSKLVKGINVWENWSTNRKILHKKTKI